MGSADTPDDELVPDEPLRGRRLRFGVVVRVGFVALVVALAAWFLISHWSQVAEAWRRVTFWPMLAAFVLGLMGTYCVFPPWRLVLGGLGSPLPVIPAGRVFFVSQLGKYIPGGVWQVVAQVTMARALGVPRSRSASAGLLSILIAVVVSAVLGAAALAINGREVLGRYSPYLLIAVVLVIFLQPGLLVWLGHVASRVTRRPIDIERIPGRTMAIAVSVQALGLTLMGLHLYFVIGTVGGTYVSPILAIGLINIALAAGMVAVFAPAGAGVREAVIVLGLSPFMNAGSALLVALMSRVLTVVADFCLAGLSVLLARRATVAPQAAA